MRLRFSCAVVLALALATGSLVNAQPRQGKIPRIGYLNGGSPAPFARSVDAWRQGLRELGYIEGQTIFIEYRYAEGHFERLPELAAELVRLNVDVILAEGDPVIAAAKQATSTIPIVMTAVGDPVGRGFAQSLARPGGNITGVSNLAVALTGKWLELARELVPGVQHVAIVSNALNPTHPLFLAEAQAPAQTLGLKVTSIGVKNADDYETAFAAMVRDRIGAAIVLPDPLSFSARTRVIEIANRMRVPSVYTFREQAEAGGLIAYGPSLVANERRAAAYVDRILKGAKPADLPIQQPTVLDLVVNQKTAAALGITVPPSLLLRADHLVQ
jgi:putative tryptophan/tyrosine transport system substrate-binding protein